MSVSTHTHTQRPVINPPVNERWAMGQNDGCAMLSQRWANILVLLPQFGQQLANVLPPVSQHFLNRPKYRLVGPTSPSDGLSVVPPTEVCYLGEIFI